MKYGTIIADPPWRYGGGGKTFKIAAEHHYPTMSVEDICALPVQDMAAPDAVLLLWATWPQLNNAMKVVTAWGFSYVTGFPWIKIAEEPCPSLFGDHTFKPSWGVGYWVHGISETVLIARRGKARHPEQTFIGLISENFGHSRKPENLYEYAESLPGPYLELFARRTREGWVSWGNQVEHNLFSLSEATP